MKDYDELVKALRLCQFGECGCGKCHYKELKGDWCTEDNHPEFFDCDDKLKLDAAAAIEELQAEVKRLKECNDELREAQTYIDHYGDKWMTSAKDVPTSAYNHGYMDGKNEAEQALEPKRGEWSHVERVDRSWETDEIFGFVVQCSICGNKTIGASEYCPNCGAKMEV